MAKGGRYLKQEEKKKGKGGKIVLIILLVLALIIGGVAIYLVRSYDDILDGLNFAQFETKEVSEEDIQNILDLSQN